MKKAIVITGAALLGLSACKNAETQSATPESTQTTDKVEAIYDPVDKYAALKWVVDADPIQDAQKAVARGDKRLWAYDTRGFLNVPGTPPKKANQLAEKHGTHIAPAMGDVIYSAQHEELRKTFISYAEKYNAFVLNLK